MRSESGHAVGDLAVAVLRGGDVVALERLEHGDAPRELVQLRRESWARR